MKWNETTTTQNDVIKWSKNKKWNEEEKIRKRKLYRSIIVKWMKMRGSWKEEEEYKEYKGINTYICDCESPRMRWLLLEKMRRRRRRDFIFSSSSTSSSCHNHRIIQVVLVDDCDVICDHHRDDGGGGIIAVLLHFFLLTNNQKRVLLSLSPRILVIVTRFEWVSDGMMNSS